MSSLQTKLENRDSLGKKLIRSGRKEEESLTRLMVSMGIESCTRDVRVIGGDTEESTQERQINTPFWKYIPRVEDDLDGPETVDANMRVRR